MIAAQQRLGTRGRNLNDKCTTGAFDSEREFEFLALQSPRTKTIGAVGASPGRQTDYRALYTSKLTRQRKAHAIITYINVCT